MLINQRLHFQGDIWQWLNVAELDHLSCGKKNSFFLDNCGHIWILKQNKRSEDIMMDCKESFCWRFDFFNAVSD